MPDLNEKHPSLEDLRKRIDSLDDELLTLFLERAGIARKVAEAKRLEGLTVFDANREEQVLQRLITAAASAAPEVNDKTVRSLFETIIRECRALQARERISLLGPPGSFSHVAATSYLGADHEFRFARTIGEAIDQLTSGKVGLAVAPIENSFGGAVGETIDALWQNDVRIGAQLHLAVHHHLIAKNPVKKLSVIRSHPQVLRQCSNWLKQYAPDAKIEETASSSIAVSLASEDDLAGSISSSLAASLYGVPIQHRNLQDDPGNETRFFVLHSAGNPAPPATGHARFATLMFTLPHRSGALVEALGVLAEHEVNMKHIVSRPVRTASWEYVFEVEIELDGGEEVLDKVNLALAGHTIHLRTLGIYPAVRLQ